MLSKSQFAIYELDREAMQLFRRGVLLRLGEQPIQLLVALLERPGEIVTREELQRKIWGNDTFVDFEQSLNRAVNRLRAALNDDATQPRFIETVPRHGYRFIAPVKETGASEPLLVQPIANITPEVILPAVKSNRRWVFAIASTLGALSVISIAFLWLRRTPGHSTLPEIKYVTSAAMCCSRLSRDGKLLAYVSPAGAGPPHIWLQQSAGGDAIQITKGSAGEIGPDFSPDGTQLAFACGHGGIGLAPTLTGEQKVLSPTGGWPVFSPDGQRILYLDETRAMTVDLHGSDPVSLAVNRDFLIHGPPVWSPDGDNIAFYGVRKRDQNKPDSWWVAPLPSGAPKPLALPGLEESEDRYIALRTWFRRKGGAGWILYSMQRGVVWKLFRIKVSPQGDVEGGPEQVTFGTGELGYSVSLAEDGKLAYPNFSQRQSIYQISMDARGEKTGLPVQLPLTPGTDDWSPSISRDGKWMAYLEEIPGKSTSVVLKDVEHGTRRVIDQAEHRSNYDVVLSPNGSRIGFERDCASGRWTSGETVNCGFVYSTGDRKSRQVCDACIPRGFSSSGSTLLVKKSDAIRDDRSRIVSIDLKTGAQRELLSASPKSIDSASYSWDDHWLIFDKPLDEDKTQVMIAPVRVGYGGAEAGWIPITNGEFAEGGPGFSPDGTMVYFTSTRDGFYCVWAQKLDPVTKRPVGAPRGFEHFHNANQKDLTGFWNGGRAEVSIGRNQILVNLLEWRVVLWMTQIE